MCTLLSNISNQSLSYLYSLKVAIKAADSYYTADSYHMSQVVLRQVGDEINDRKFEV